MDNILRIRKILGFVFFTGLAIVFITILVALSAQNAKADVIVPVDQPTIQDAVNVAIPGENIFVWDGSYNEVVTVDRSVQIIGNGSATTTIDAAGLGIPVTISAEGVEITGFNITTTGANPGVYSTVAGLNIHDNVFSTLREAIYVRIGHNNEGSVTHGDIIIDDNDIVGRGCIFISAQYNRPILGSSFVFGQTVITDNRLYSCTTDGVQINDFHVGDMNTGSVTWGDVIITDNLVSAGAIGIGFWGDFSNITEVTVDVGRLDVSGNDVITPSSVGIHLDWWNFFNGMWGTTTATLDHVLVNNNTITSGQYGIHMRMRYLPEGDMRELSSLTTGNFQVYNNNVTTQIPGWSCIKLELERIAFGMFEDTSVSIGEFEVDSNVVDSQESGLNISWLFVGTNMQNNAIGSVGDFRVTNNQIDSVTDGIIFQISANAFNMFNAARFFVGDIVIDDNVINSGQRGIFHQISVSGAQMFGDSGYFKGNTLITNNDIISSDSSIEYREGDCASMMNGNSAFSMGDRVFSLNTANSSTANGISFSSQGIGISMNDNSTAYIGSLEVHMNDLEAWGLLSSGSQLSLYRWAYNMFDFSRFQSNDTYVTNNSVSSSMRAMGFTMDECGSLSGNSVAYIPSLVLIENTLNSEFETFVYMSSLTPFWKEPAAVLVFGDVFASENSFSSENNGVWFQWDDSIAGVSEPAFYLNNNDFFALLGGLSALAFQDIDYALIESAIMVDWGVGLGVVDSEVTVFNSSFVNSGFYDFIVQGVSVLFVVNCTFDTVFFFDADGLLVVGWFMNVQVQSPHGYGIPNADIVVKDVFSVEAFNGTSDNLGRVFNIITWSHIENVTGIIQNFNNYTVQASLGPYSSFATPDPVMNMTKWVYVTLHEPELPIFLGDTSDVAGTTGDPYNFGIDVTDNWGVYAVYVNYRFDIVGPFANQSMTGSGPYSLTIPLATDYVGPMEYYFAAEDICGNWALTGVTQVPITDNDPPTGLVDGSDILATTGDAFTFSVNAVDNIGITNAHVVYWFGVAAPTNSTMLGTGPYTLLIVIPLNSLDPLHYYFAITDAAGNWLIGPQIDIDIVDNDPPFNLVDNSDVVGTTGDVFNFIVNGSDNIGLANAYVIYWFGGGPPVNATMTGSGPFTRGVTIPSSSLDMLHYYFTLVDTDGNWLLGSQVDINVLDNDAPTILDDASDTTATTGDPFTFLVDATDNIGVANASVVYWFGTGSPTNSTLTGPTPYNHGIMIPLNSLDTLHYYFVLSDAAGNWRIGPQVDVMVIDNDPPSNLVDSSDTLATTGDQFTFNVDMTDNIGIGNAHVTYWFGTGPQMNVTMTGTAPSTLTIVIPWNSLDTLHYYFTVSDSGGVWLVGPHVDVNVTDNDAPTDIVDSSDTVATTGDAFDFGVDASDNIGVVEAYIIYWFGAGAPTNASMIGPAPFSFNTVTPSNSLDMLHYYFAVRDGAGNWLVGTQVDLAVADNGAPTNLVDSSDILGTTGDPFNFEVDASDNIGVTEAFVLYWYGAGAPMNATMSGAGPFTSTINIPSDSLDMLHYYFAVRDAGGNWLVGLQIDINVQDNDNPTLVLDSSDTSATTGDEFTFLAFASDNIAVFEVRFVYWFGTGSQQTITSSTMPFTDSISVPQGSLDALHYYIVIEDTSGNIFNAAQVDITVQDNDPPFNIVDTSSPSEGNFTFSVDASDNIDVVEAEVFYWFGTGTPASQILPGAGPFTTTIALSSDQTLHYYFVMRDAASNEAQSITKDFEVSQVTDDEPPTISNDQSENGGQEDEEFNFQVDVSDNTGVAEVEVAFWFGTDESQKVFFELIGVGDTYSGSITLRDSGTLRYYFVAEDLAGNKVEGPEVTVSITPAPEDGDGEEPAAEADMVAWMLVVILLVIVVLLVLMMLRMRSTGTEESHEETSDLDEEDQDEEEPTESSDV